MALTKWSAFYPYVLPDVYECPEITVEIAVRDAAIEFCRRTGVWQESLDPITVSPNVALYDYEPPTNSVIEKITEVSIDGLRMAPCKLTDLPVNRNDLTGKPRLFSMLFGDQLRLYPIPDSSTKMHLTVLLTPSSTATGIDTTLFERYKEIIAHGAKHRLTSVPSKSWTNPAAAQYHMQQFVRGISEARLRIDGGMSTSILRQPFV